MRIVILASFTLLTACAVGPAFEAPQAQLPERWRGTTNANAIETEWWKQFGSPQLDALVTRARSNNLDLRIATLRVAQSRVQRSLATGERWPAVNASAGYQRRRDSEHGVSTRMIEVMAPPGAERERIVSLLAEPFDVYQAGFDASWELDLWGRVRRAVESADARVAASNEGLRDAELTLIAEVARTYLELAGTREQLRIARDDVTSSTDQLELTRHRVAGGLLTQLDLDAQRAQLSSARAQIPALEHQEATLLNALALLVGAAPGSLDAEVTTTPPVIPTVAAAGVPSELARRRPDIRRAEAQLHAATADIGVAVADLYPRISLTGSFAQQSLDASNFTAWGARQWVVGPSLSLPIFQGGRLRTVIELRKLQQQEAAVTYQQTVLNAWHEIETALGACATEQRRNQELADTVTASRDAYEIAHVRYEHGLTNYWVDLDAHRTLLQAQRALSESSTRTSVQWVALYKALGGGVTSAEPR